MHKCVYERPLDAKLLLMINSSLYIAKLPKPPPSLERLAFL